MMKYAIIALLAATTAAYAASPLEIKSKEDLNALVLSYKAQVDEASEKLTVKDILLSRAETEIARLKEELDKAKTPPPAPPTPPTGALPTSPSTAPMSTPPGPKP